VIVAASLHVSKKSCHSALPKQQQLNQLRRSHKACMKKPPRLSPRRFFYAPV
jgi:hypothetical protein